MKINKIICHGFHGNLFISQYAHNIKWIFHCIASIVARFLALINYAHTNKRHIIFILRTRNIAQMRIEYFQVFSLRRKVYVHLINQDIFVASRRQSSAQQESKRIPANIPIIFDSSVLNRIAFGKRISNATNTCNLVERFDLIWYKWLLSVRLTHKFQLNIKNSNHSKSFSSPCIDRENQPVHSTAVYRRNS